MNDEEFLNYLHTKANIKLTPEQNKISTSVEGAYMCLSCPGSGKTTTACTRIAYMVLVKGINPKKIMTVTYSRASANDMKDRFTEKFGDIVEEPVYFATIHSFAYSVIKNYSFRTGKQYTLIEGSDSAVAKNSILRNLYRKYNNESINEDKLEELSGFICFLVNRMIPHKDLDMYNKKFPVPNFKGIYIDYLNILEQNNYLDFDRMLQLCDDILSSDTRALNYYSNLYSHYQLDEGQDTCTLQFSILVKLSKRTGNLCVFADDDQSLYSWRGADLKKIIDFKNFYSHEATILFMNRNFRSTKRIVNLYSEFIKINKARIQKNIYTENEQGEEVKFITTKDEFEQLDYVINHLKLDDNHKEIAVLYRNNLSAIPLVDRLLKEGIPFYIKDAIPGFFTHWITKDFLSFFALALNPSNVESFSSLYYKMKSYIKKEEIQALTLMRDKLELNGVSVFEYLSLNPNYIESHRDRLKEFDNKFRNLSKMKPHEAMSFIEDELNYKNYLKEYAKKFGYSLEGIDNMISTLKVIASGTDSINSFMDKLASLQDKMSFSKKNRGKNVVTLSTMHSSKGLEFNTTLLISMTSQFPNPESVQKMKDGDAADYEEENRICYVAISRARKNLILIYPSKINNKKVEVSQFFSRLKKIAQIQNLTASADKITAKVTSAPAGKDTNIIPMIREGVRLNHKKWGSGSIINLNGDMVTVMFGNGAVKTLSLNTCIDNNLIELAG